MNADNSDLPNPRPSAVKLRRYDMKKLLADPELRRKLIVQGTIATQAREGIDVSKADAEDSYYVVTQAERAAFFGLVSFRGGTGENDQRHIEFIRELQSQGGKLRIDVSLRDFGNIESAPLAYAKVAMIGHVFTEQRSLEPNFGIARQGKSTADLARWTRKFWEIPERSQWKVYVKSDYFSRFYTDFSLVIDWREENRPKLKADGNGLPNQQYYFQQGITWTFRSGKGFVPKYMPPDCVFSQNGMAIIPNSDADIDWMLGILASRFGEYLLEVMTSTHAYEAGILKRFPLAFGSEKTRSELSSISVSIRSIKSAWDTGNEICTRFDRPWLIQPAVNNKSHTLTTALDAVLDRDAQLDAELTGTYAQLNTAVYRLYDVNDTLRAKIDSAIGARPPELVWPQMEGQDRDQKRREHVDRLLTYLVKQIVADDEDRIVCLQRVAHEASLLERLRTALAACFPDQDPSSLETEVVNELKKKPKGYHRAESLSEWLHDVFFETHNALYQQRPLLWHLASSQTRTEPGFACLVHAHHFDADALAKLRSVYIRDRIAVLKREAAQAGNDGKADLRFDLLALAEEVEAYDAKLAQLQEGAQTGPEGGERDYRILTPWKTPETRPQGWHPDVDDGIKVNLAPLARTKLLRINLKLGENANDE